MNQIPKQPTPIKSPPTIEQLMLTFAFIADVESGDPDKGNRDVKKIVQSLFKKNDKSVLSKILSGWELVYGPAVYGEFHNSARNTTMIFYNKKEKHMVIGVAGTNFINKFDWFTEDVSVEKLVPFNKYLVALGRHNIGKAKGGHVSQGTATALWHTWNKGVELITPIKWLKKNINKKKYPTTKLSVTGHSLGGAISPALAISMNLLRKKWNGKGVSLAAFIFAGPTPGDEQFRDYVSSNIKVYSYRNTLDVVPHAWQTDQLKEIFKLYSKNLEVPTKDNNGSIVYWVIEKLIADSKYASSHKHVYLRWKEDAFFKGELAEISPKAKKGANTAALMMLKVLGKRTINDLLMITGQDSVKKDKKAKKYAVLQPYMAYFLEFLGTLGDQHTRAYHTFFFDNSTFDKELHKIYYKPSKKKKKTSNIFKAIDAIGVIKELINMVATYYDTVNSQHHT